MDETKLRTIAQLQEFLDATPEVSFTAAEGGSDLHRYERISRVLERFDYRQWQATTLEQVMGVVDSYIRWYNEKRIKISLGSLSPLEYRESVGLMA